MLGRPVPTDYEVQLRTMYARRAEARRVAATAAQAEASAARDADFLDGFDGADLVDWDGPGGDDIPF